MKPTETTIPQEITDKWQGIVDIIAEIMKVPAALIMQVEPPEISVLVSSHSSKNPYERGKKAQLNTGLYCETVMSSRQQLLVPNALENEEWKSNPYVKLGMISYLGFPVALPSGDIFGTICVLDNKPNAYNELYQKIMLQFRDMLESDLKYLHNLNQLTQEIQISFEGAKRSRSALLSILEDEKQTKEEIRKLNDELEDRVKKRTAELEKSNNELKILLDGFIGQEMRIVGLKKRVAELESAQTQGDQ